MNRIIIFLLIFISCDNKTCIINYHNEFTTEPIMYIISENEDKKYHYNISLQISLSDFTLYSKGLLFCKNRAFYIKSCEPESNYFKYFDFKKRLNESYKIKINVNNNTYNITAFVDKLLMWENTKVYAFRFKNTFIALENKYYDTVILASIEDGIIGSYISGEYNNKEYMIDPAGIVQELDEYSNLEIRVLK